jgi:hypothetical protein
MWPGKGRRHGRPRVRRKAMRDPPAYGVSFSRKKMQSRGPFFYTSHVIFLVV